MKRKTSHFTAGLLLAGLLALAACQQDPITFEGPYHVRFTDTVATARESFPRLVRLRIHVVGPQPTESVTVRYITGGTAREGVDYAIQGSQGLVTIPAGQSFGEIELRLINNANDRLESQTVVFTLIEVTPASLRVGFGKNNNIGRRLTFTIQDDCILSGYYIGTRRQGNSTVTIPDVQVTSTDCNEFMLSNWNVGLGGLFDFEAEKPTLKFIDKKDNSIEIPPQANENFNSAIQLFGDGAWNPQNGNLSLNIRFRVPRTNPVRDTVISLPTLTFIPEKN